MRMWGVDPKTMCRRHLLGEHVEMHMFIGALNKGTCLHGYMNTGLVDLSLIYQRHEDLVKEMISRGYKHNSPIEESMTKLCGGYIDPTKNAVELSSRCNDCRKILGV